ncbi:MAG TPA: hypothetical protein VFQ60_04300, partial [Patescibacteria group bacterium]|nr:hypothetical protein [Patescibacteria group bacterium]
MAKKKILIYTVPFSGHLNVLQEAIKKWGSEFDVRLVITGWRNIPADLTHKKIDTVFLEKSELKETDPALWTFPRIADLFSDSLRIAEDFSPDLILYDFFSLEGYFVGKKLNIPYWCSIPAMIGPFLSKDYLSKKLQNAGNKKAIERIKKEHDISLDLEKVEMVSDGLYLPGELNLLWSYRTLTPKNFLLHRANRPYEFVGCGMADCLRKKALPKRPLVYFSLGTVVMNNLWNQQAEVRPALIRFIEAFAKCSAERSIDVLFVN